MYIYPAAQLWVFLHASMLETQPYCMLVLNCDLTCHPPLPTHTSHRKYWSSGSEGREGRWWNSRATRTKRIHWPTRAARYTVRSQELKASTICSFLSAIILCSMIPPPTPHHPSSFTTTHAHRECWSSGSEGRERKWWNSRNIRTKRIHRSSGTTWYVLWEYSN